MSEAQGCEFHDDPEELIAVAGRGRKRQRPMKSAMVPVRFTPETIGTVKRFAIQDGVTVSTWIRRLVAREIERRQPPATSTALAERVDVQIEPVQELPVSSASPSIKLELAAC
jgi:hypothetical protein